MKKVFGNSIQPPHNAGILLFIKTRASWHPAVFSKESCTANVSGEEIIWGTPETPMWMLNSSDSVQIIDEGVNVC